MSLAARQQYNSRILIGEVVHSREEPVQHHFSYPLYYYIFDLDELPRLSSELLLFNYNKAALVSLFDEDYFTGGSGSIKQKVHSYLAKENMSEDVGRIELITAARYFMYVFNPVSFYYCYRASDPSQLLCIVCEVNNTFGERHLYLIKKPHLTDQQFAVTDMQPKAFYVSPFYDVSGDYEFLFSEITQRVDIRINVRWENRKPFRARLSGNCLPLTPRTLLSTLTRYPLSAALTMPRITWQAVKLFYLKKLPVIEKPVPHHKDTIRLPRPTRLESAAMSFLIKRAKKITSGFLHIDLPEGGTFECGDSQSKDRAVLSVKSYRMFWRIVRDGGIGLGESYQAGEWESPDVTAVLSLFFNNTHILNEKSLNLALPLRWFERARHWLKRNRLGKSKENISAHYDLSNELFSLFLDRSMTYSCARYHSKEESLEEAQQNKIHSMISKAQIGPSDHVLEIGSGWGALAIEAVQQTGCRVTTVTLSEEQLKLVIERAAQAGVSDRINARLCDYRTIEGSFDKIISVEMLEAVGADYLGQFFATCEKLLAPNGLVSLQVITYPDYDYRDYVRRADWIQKHIFPGCHLPSMTALLKAISTRSKFWVESVENIGPHYARTLRDWRDRFNLSISELDKLGFDSRFRRTWEFYLCSCEAEFRTRWLSVHQIVLSRPNNKKLMALDEEVFAVRASSDALMVH